MTRRHPKALANERDLPNIIEISMPVNGFDVRLSREMAAFHHLHDIGPRFGPPRMRNNRCYSRWCFADPVIADAFRERFGGTWARIKA
jgi:hypothetical protein